MPHQMQSTQYMVRKYVYTGIGLAVLLSTFTSFAAPTANDDTDIVERYVTDESTNETYITNDIDRDYSDTDDDTENTVPVHFIITVPTKFMQEVDIYLDAMPTIVTYNRKATGNGYVFTKNIPKGSYHVTVGIPNGDGLFNIDAPDTYSTDNNIFKVNITAVDMTDKSDNGEDDWDSDIDYSPASIDYTNGASNSATVNAKMYPCYSVKTAVLTLQDQNGNNYKIPFNNENGFEAQVKLPSGIYHETTDIEVTLDDISDTSGASFEWAYDDDHSAEFGTQTYNIEKGSNTDLRPYVIMMDLNNKKRVIDSTFLNSNALQKNTFNDKKSNKDSLQNEASVYDKNIQTANSDEGNQSFGNMDGVKISDGSLNSITSTQDAKTENNETVPVSNETAVESTETDDNSSTSASVNETVDFEEDEDSGIDVPMIILTLVGIAVLIFGIIYTIRKKEKQ